MKKTLFSAATTAVVATGAFADESASIKPIVGNVIFLHNIWRNAVQFGANDRSNKRSASTNTQPSALRPNPGTCHACLMSLVQTTPFHIVQL